MRTATVILAAGQAERLGGASKPLLRADGELLAVRALRTAWETGTVPVLVLGHRSEEVLEALNSDARGLLGRTDVVVLSGRQRQLADSFRMGVQRAAELGAQWIAVLLVDQPGIGAAALKAVLDEHSPGRITQGAVAGRPTHPVVFDTGDAAAAAALAEGDEGARRYLRAQAHRLDLMDLTGIADDTDIDTPEDLL
ncbi:nucleotidyltransferase family protein [Nesterenkonia ebinurensis]|uniref:nucleotidyltransferase family protein n=1 Tax=Nesterenkonia ebinurensis TaxID=2608252 RepID=UPI00168BABE7|nr:NTP transferase domain-containing protein [Nesterenkonia ebinurensis]